MSRFHDRMAAIQQEQETRLELIRPAIEITTEPPIESPAGIENDSALETPPVQQSRPDPEKSPTIESTSGNQPAPENNTGSVTNPGIETTVGSLVSAVDPGKIPLLSKAKKPRELASVWESLSSRTVHEAKVIRWVAIAQQSMTGGQERLYEALWRARTDRLLEVVSSEKHCRQIRAGHRTLAHLARCTVKSIRDLLAQMVAKQIVYSHGDFDSASMRGTLYDVFSYEEILRRQRALGCCYIVKRGPGIEFVVPQGWAEKTNPGSISIPGVKNTGDPGLETAASPVIEITSPLEQKYQHKREQPTTHGIPNELWQGFAKLDPNIDDGAIQRLWREGREVVRDLSAEELLYFFEGRARLLYQNRNIKNPIGLLLNSVRDWITPRKVEARREQLRIDAEEAEQVRRELGV